jgi:hypothetical protein
VTAQLELDIGQAPCPGCGSTRHYGCGYDLETVRPTMSVADALSATLKRAVEESGFDGACRRIPGLLYGGERPADHPIPQKQENR